MIYLADPVYNPNNVDPKTITAQLKLANGVSIATFLGYGASSLGHMGKAEDRAQLARNLLLHADIMNMVNKDKDFFTDVKLKVSEGIYEAGPTETLGGLNVLKADGRMVGYQVINGTGQLDLERTFDVAVYLKDMTRYRKIILDYDTFNPDGSLTATILVEVPTVNEQFDVEFSQNIETQYNGKLLSKNEFVEVLPKVV